MKEALIVCVMNRKNRIRDAVKNWLEYPSVGKIILVDWSSKEPLTRQMLPYEKVLIARVEDQPYWRLAQAYNFAASFVTEDTICKMDADYRMTSDFLSEQIKEGEFWRGDTRHPKETNQVYINGFVRFWRKDFLAVNGYNERIEGYGWDDTDLYSRFEKMGLKTHWVPYGPITHVPHPNTDRLNNLQPTELSLDDSIRQNRKLVEEHPWTIKDKKTEYNIKEVDKNFFVAKVTK